MITSTVNAVFKGGMNFSAEIHGHSIEIDTIEANGGHNLGTRPKALMLASLAGCTGIDVVSILNKMRVSFTELSIKVEGRLTETEPSVYDEVVVHYTIRVAKEDELKVAKAVILSQEKYCGVTKMFEAFARVSHTVAYL